MATAAAAMHGVCAAAGACPPGASRDHGHGAQCTTVDDAARGCTRKQCVRETGRCPQLEWQESHLGGMPGNGNACATPCAMIMFPATITLTCTRARAIRRACTHVRLAAAGDHTPARHIRKAPLHAGVAAHLFKDGSRDLWEFDLAQLGFREAACGVCQRVAGPRRWCAAAA